VNNSASTNVITALMIGLSGVAAVGNHIEIRVARHGFSAARARHGGARDEVGMPEAGAGFQAKPDRQ